MKPNRFREVLKSGQMPVGHMIMEFGTRGIAKIFEAANTDFVMIDMEHTGFDSERVADLIAWFKATPITPFVRIPQRLYHFIARTMDAGAMGIMVANVETPEQATEIVKSMKFAPMGYRGLGLGTAHNDFIPPDPVAYFKQANESSVVICQIESTLGVKNAEAIASVPGVDILWIGHYDLSQSMGIPAQFHHPDFLAAMKHVIDTAKRCGKLSAIQPGSLEQTAEWMAMGFDVMSYSVDIGVYRNALSSELQAVRKMAAARK